MRERRLKRILLVDDDPDIRDVATLALRAAGGYTVEPCGSAREAIDRSTSFRPDLILLDVMDARNRRPRRAEGAARARGDGRDPGGLHDRRVQIDEIERYKELGCLGVIPKPFDPAALPARLEALWGRQRRRRAEVHLEEFETLRAALPGQAAGEDGRHARRGGRPGRGGLGPVHVGVPLPPGPSAWRAPPGSTGCPTLGRSAGVLEDIVKRLLTGPTWPPSSSPAELETLVKAVDRTARSEARQARTVCAGARAARAASWAPPHRSGPGRGAYGA